MRADQIVSELNKKVFDVWTEQVDLENRIWYHVPSGYFLKKKVRVFDKRFNPMMMYSISAENKVKLSNTGWTASAAIVKIFNSLFSRLRMFNLKLIMI
jgi:hypothetical protein